MLTPKQKETLAFIRDHLARYGESPSLAEIAAGTGIRSRSAVHRHVRALADSGHIELLPGRKRGIQLVGEAAEGLFDLPLVGRIAAGRPIEAIPGQDRLNIGDLLLGRDRFALEVRGDSMVGAGILDGDTVIVEPGTTAREGDIVVALIDDEEATLKRLRQGEGTVTLVAENPAVEPMTYHAGRVTIQGIVIGQLRSYR